MTSSPISTASIPIPDLADTLLPSTTSTLPDPATHVHPLPSPFHNTQPQPELITQGAEALVYKTTFLTSSNPAALKFRPSKPYRHPTLDARLTKQRVLAEARVLVKLSGLRSQGIAVPSVLSLEWDVGRKVKGLDGAVEKVRGDKRDSAAGGAWILMEWIDGCSVKELLRKWDSWYKTHGEKAHDEEKQVAEEEVRKLLRRVGRAVGIMHSNGGVVHGDLTSSNIMVRPPNLGKSTLEGGNKSVGLGDPTALPDLNGEIVLIDFGLATQSVQDEDRSVDLYVLERAFGSTHPRQEGWFDQEVLQSQDGYRGAFKGANGILKRLEEDILWELFVHQWMSTREYTMVLGQGAPVWNKASKHWIWHSRRSARLSSAS